MIYPRWMYRRAENEEGFEGLLFQCAEDEALVKDELFDSPADVKPATYKEHMAAWESKDEKPKKRGKR